MTKQTRRRVIVGAVALMLTLPTESMLLKALSTTTPKAAAQQWASGLTTDQLSAAATSIEAYPTAYRRAIMGRLPAATQAYVWQNHIQTYLANNPDANADGVEALQEVMAILTPDSFTRAATDAEQTEIKTLAARVSADLGKDVALNLMYTLGPTDGTFKSAQPLSDKIALFLHDKFVALARRVEDCECSTDWGCSGAGSCAGGTGCNPTSSWPACGWLWKETCNGMCDAGGGIDN